jgi:hypothetical protein
MGFNTLTLFSTSEKLIILVFIYLSLYDITYGYPADSEYSEQIDRVLWNSFHQITSDRLQFAQSRQFLNLT